MRRAAARAAQTETSQRRPGRLEEAGYPLNELQRSSLAATDKLRTDGRPSDAP